MSNHLTTERLDAMRKTLQTPSAMNAAQQVARNALTHASANAILIDSRAADALHDSFSHELNVTTKASNQKRSGRCWLFAYLNLLRTELVRQHHLPPTFELSAAYLFFWDQLEKSQQFLQYMIDLRNRPLDDRVMVHLLTAPVSDGGTWHMLCNIAHKYGVVPKHCMSESVQANQTSALNSLLCAKLRQFAHELRERKHSCADCEKLVRETMLPAIYRILVLYLGEPPKTMRWEYMPEEGKKKTGTGTRRRRRGAERVQLHRPFSSTPRMTPLKFFRTYVNLEDYVCVINYPCASAGATHRPYYRLYTVRFMDGMVDGRMPMEMLNLPATELQRAARECLDEGRAVWFACDVGQDSSTQMGIMDPAAFQYRAILGEPRCTLSKCERMHYKDGSPSHAMVIRGYHAESQIGGRAAVGSKCRRRGTAVRHPRGGKKNTTKNTTKNTNVVRWLIENSWGEKSGKHGNFVMSAQWFDEHVYTVVVPKRLVQEVYERAQMEEAITLDPWDVFGNLY